MRGTEALCGTHCGLSTHSDWDEALRQGLKGDPAQERPLRVLPLHDTQARNAAHPYHAAPPLACYTPYQAHAFTCSTRRGSLGQHFRVLGGEGGGSSSDGGADQLPPPLTAALATLRRFDWVGLTDLYDQSVCLLHYQANGSASY